MPLKVIDLFPSFVIEFFICRFLKFLFFLKYHVIFTSHKTRQDTYIESFKRLPSLKPALFAKNPFPECILVLSRTSVARSTHPSSFKDEFRCTYSCQCCSCPQSGQKLAVAGILVLQLEHIFSSSGCRRGVPQMLQ